MEMYVENQDSMRRTERRNHCSGRYAVAHEHGGKTTPCKPCVAASAFQVGRLLQPHSELGPVNRNVSTSATALQPGTHSEHDVMTTSNTADTREA